MVLLLNMHRAYRHRSIHQLYAPRIHRGQRSSASPVVAGTS